MADYSYQFSIRNEKGGISAQFSGNGSGSQATAGVVEQVQAIPSASVVAVNLGLLADARLLGLKNLGTADPDQRIFLGPDDGAGWLKPMFVLEVGGDGMLLRLCELAMPREPLLAFAQNADSQLLIFALEA